MEKKKKSLWGGNAREEKRKEMKRSGERMTVTKRLEEKD